MFNKTKYSALGEEQDDSERNSDDIPERLLHENALSIGSEKKNCRVGLFAVVVSLILVNTVWTLCLMNGLMTYGSTSTGPKLISSPAREAISYEIVESNSTIYSKNSYMGKPRPEQTAAWYESYTKWANIRVSAQDLEAVGRQSIEMSDGSGYLGTLEVFHQLHCLDYIRMYIGRDYYHSAETDQRRFEHADHCIDTIRLALMCHGDVSLVTFDWVDGEYLPFANFHVEHECRSWDGILEWTKAHQANKNAVIRPGGNTSLADILGRD